MTRPKTDVHPVEAWRVEGRLSRARPYGWEEVDAAIIAALDKPLTLANLHKQLAKQWIPSTINSAIVGLHDRGEVALATVTFRGRAAPGVSRQPDDLEQIHRVRG